MECGGEPVTGVVVVVVGLLVGIAGGVWCASNNYSHQDPGNGLPSEAGTFGVAYGGGAGLVGAGPREPHREPFLVG